MRKKNNKNVNELLCRKNGTVKLSELINLVPNSIFLTKRHIDVCYTLAKSQGYVDELLMVYVNLLVVHSKKARSYTALIELVLNNKLDLVSISSDYVSKRELAVFINVERVVFLEEVSPSSNRLLNKSFKKTLVKYFMHQFYRLNCRKNKKANVAIRSWVEITKKMYGEHYETSLILIYPFYFNIKRHINYIIHCFRTYDKVTLCGLPYSFVDLLKIGFPWKNSDLHTVLFEMNAYKKHALELYSKGITQIYTSDEFEAGSVILSTLLRKRGVQIKNTSHGLGLTCPYVGYDTFHVYNNAQKAYYAHKSTNTDFIVAPRVNANLTDKVQSLNKENPILIFIEAKFEAVNWLYEMNLQTNAIDALKLNAERKKINFCIKAHPNRSDHELKVLRLKHDVPIIRSLSSLTNVAPIFITINSTAYYDFKSQGPFLFINDGFFDIENFYGEPLKSHSIEQLIDEIDRQLRANLNEPKELVYV